MRGSRAIWSRSTSSAPAACTGCPTTPPWCRGPSFPTDGSARAPSGPGSQPARPWPGPSDLHALEDGSGVEDAVRVEGVLDPPGQRHHVRAELVGQRRLLGASHAVLAGDGAAELDGERHHLVERLTGAGRGGGT